MDRAVAPIRVLHVVASMDRGGLETFLMNVMRCIDRQRYRFDFCTTLDRPGQYDEEIRSLGGKIIPVVRRGGLRTYSRRLGALLAQGHYDVIHSHMYTFSGIVLWTAHRCGMQHRLAHIHTSGDGQRPTLGRKVYRGAMKYLVSRHATRVLGCAGWVLDNFLGPRWPDDPRAQVVYYGIDLRPFGAATDRQGVRTEFGLAGEAPLLIHVGRFVEAKNHRRLIEIFKGVHDARPETHLLLVGEGGLMAPARTQVNELGLAEWVHFAGVRSDVPRLMKAADLMVMPSIREGMPVTMLEATAAGLPIVITDMPGMREANEVCCQGKLISGDAPSAVWIQAVLAGLDAPQSDPVQSLDRVTRSPVAHDAAAGIMAQVYDQCQVHRANSKD